MNCADARDRIHAYMDGALDLMKALDMEEHLNGCRACSQACKQQNVSRTIVRRHAMYYAAPSSLRSHICASIRAVDLPPRAAQISLPPWTRSWFGAALAFSIMSTWATTLYFASPKEIDLLPEEIVSGHVRSLISSRLADFGSADRRAVQPWFIGKLDFSPPVDDLSSQGFALVGGRLDYIKERRVAALVYSRNGRPISVFEWPAAAHDASLRTLSYRGYNLVNWTRSGMFFCAVSDLSHAELAEFARVSQAIRD